MPAQPHRLGVARAINLLLALGQRDEARRLAAEHAKHLQRRVELTLAAVNQEDVRIDDLFVMPAHAKTPRYHFADRCEIVHAFHTANPIAAITGLERQPVDERHERRDRAFAAEMRDVNAFDDAWDPRQPENLPQTGQSALRLDLENLRLHVFIDVTA